MAGGIHRPGQDRWAADRKVRRHKSVRRLALELPRVTRDVLEPGRGALAEREAGRFVHRVRQERDRSLPQERDETDADGRDMFSRVLYGGRYSLGIGLVVVAAGMILGLIAGGLAGFFGGAVDEVLMRFADALAARAAGTNELCTRENGMPIRLSRFANGAFPSALLRYYAELIGGTEVEEIRPAAIGHTIVRREAVGVVGAGARAARFPCRAAAARGPSAPG